ncbi:MAG TPA: threonine/serine dehydratase [Opitutaceae bacterium]|nr:threonine/serine dehydratase [Opitutaceae bacterium]
MNATPLTLESVQEARARLDGGLRLTPCAYSAPLSDLCGMSIFTKRDFEQVTGSFKERGARNALLSLTPAQRARGVIAASAGNHALGLAYHGGLLGIAVTVVMPKSAPSVKVSRCRALGANVVLSGNTFDEAARFAVDCALRENRTYVHPFDDPNVVAGQATLALEVLEQVPGLDAIVVPVGGGGLLAGVATVIKALSPETLVIGVEPAHATSLTVALNAGRPVRVPTSSSVADGLLVSQVGEYTFHQARTRVDDVVTVTEDDLSRAIFELAEREDVRVEGAGAAALAACLSGKLGYLQGRRVVLPLTGRNIDPAVHSRALWRGWTDRELSHEKQSAEVAH